MLMKLSELTDRNSDNVQDVKMWVCVGMRYVGCVATANLPDAMKAGERHKFCSARNNVATCPDVCE